MVFDHMWSDHMRSINKSFSFIKKNKKKQQKTKTKKNPKKTQKNVNQKASFRVMLKGQEADLLLNMPTALAAYLRGK